MRQAFINLITNSIKFSGSGTVITVTGGRVPNGDVTVAVVDQGRGIDEAQLPYVFDAFWQGDAHRRRSQEGVGLGLAITRRLIEAHGGSISAQSRQHSGTTMIIRLPASRVLPEQDDMAQAAS
jgi:two-component system sensor histidine kinase BaeS